MDVRMRRRCLSGLAAGIVMVMFGSVGMAQSKDDPAFGVWKLNVAKSKYSPGPAPKEMTVTIEAAGPGRKVSVEGVAGDGTPLKWGYSGNLDGKDIRVTGNNPDADMVMLKRINASTTRSTFKKAGARTLVNGISVSPDGKTLTVASTGVNGKGQTVKNTQVFEKP
jgi:hypothetical protein